MIKNETEMKNVEQQQRNIGSEETNVLKILEVIKNSIKNFENLAKNKFRKVVETEMNKILEDLSVMKVSKILNLKGIYDYNIEDEIM